MPVVGSVPKSNSKPQHPDRGAARDPNERPDGTVFDRDLGVLPAGPGPEYEGLGVQCVNHATQRKLSGVAVRWATQPDLDAWLQKNPGRALTDVDPETLLTEIFPKTARASMSADGGVALTPSAPGRMLVDARQGTLYGFAWVDRGLSPRARIEMVEDRDLFFRVPGPGDAPRAGVPIVVRDSSCAEIWRGTTQGNEGIARMRHAGFVIARDASPGECVAYVDGVVPSVRTTSLALDALPLNDVELGLVPTGRVVVVVVDERGERVRVPYPVRLSSPGADACGRETTRLAKSGEAVFEFVEPGVPLRVEVNGLDDYETLVRDAVGPDAAGATRTLEFAFQRRLPSVKVQFVEVPAIPVVSARGAAWLECRVDGRAQSFPARREVATDVDGRAHLVFDVPPPGASDFVLFVALRNRYDDWYSSGRRPLPAGAFAGVTDLGVCEVSEMPTLAAGYVLDDRSSPVPGALVEIAHGDDPAQSPEEFAVDARWTTAADSMGRFRMRGFVDGARLALSASAPDHVRPARLEFPRGERKLSLALPRTSSISGKLFLPDRMPIDDVRIWVESEEGPLPALIQANGAFRVGQIAPGTASLNVFVAGFEEPVYSVPGLTAKPGVEINDANVVTIDLRLRLAFVSVYVLGADDRPVASGVARVIEDDGEKRTVREVPLRSGFASFYSLVDQVDVEIAAEGYAPRTLVGVDRDTEVRLEPIPR